MAETTEHAHPPTPKRRRLIGWIIGVGIFLILFLCVTGGAIGILMLSTNSLSGDAVAIVYIEGTLGASPLSGGTALNSEQIINTLQRANAMPNVKAIVLRINSPGGAAVTADEIYRAIKRIDKPVVVSMGNVAASGGYYIACAADEIVANPATLTGSIGVYSQLLNAADLLEKLGIEAIIIRSGEMKAAGNPFEHPTQDEIAIEQAIVDEIYAMFVDVVSENRGLPRETVEELADGRAYTGKQALQLGLVDRLGDLEDAIQRAADLAGITGTPAVIPFRPTPSFLDILLGAQQNTTLTLEDLLALEVPTLQMRYIGP